MASSAEEPVSFVTCKNRLVGSGAVLTLLGCQASPTAPSPVGASTGQVALSTDRASYLAVSDGSDGPYRTYMVTVVSRFTNGLTRPVYLERCYPDTPFPIYGVVPAEGVIEAAYNPVWACVGHDRQFVVKSGATRTDTLRLHGPNGWDGRTHEPFGTLVGRFRLSYSAGSCPEVIRCPVSGATGSNAFEIQLMP